MVIKTSRGQACPPFYEAGRVKSQHVSMYLFFCLRRAADAFNLLFELWRQWLVAPPAQSVQYDDAHSTASGFAVPKGVARAVILHRPRSLWPFGSFL